MYTSKQELYHHGIKGMKWGVRRFQDKYGKLTAAGRKRYGSQEGSSPKKTKSKRRLSLEEKYRKQGMSAKDAELAAYRRIRTEKLVAAVGATTLVAVTAYASNQYVKNRTDQMLKSGDLLQRIEMQDTGGKLHYAFYASANKADNKRYLGMLGSARQKQTGEAYIMKLMAHKDIKVASKKNAQKVFEDLQKADPAFKKSVDEVMNLNLAGNASPAKRYELFNQGLVRYRYTHPKENVAEKFYDAMTEKGYNAIQDINDMKYSGYSAKNPLIVFNTTDNIMVKEFRKLGSEEINKHYAPEVVKAFLSSQDAKKLAVSAVAGSTTNYALNTYSVNAYRRKYPNSGLSDKEIIKLLQEQNKKR